jgi:hypothetical protein
MVLSTISNRGGLCLPQPKTARDDSEYKTACACLNNAPVASVWNNSVVTGVLFITMEVLDFYDFIHLVCE